MKEKNINNLIKIIFLFVLGIFINVIFKEFPDFFKRDTVLLITIIYIIFTYSFIFGKHKLSFILYIFTLIIILLNRDETDVNISDYHYFSEWLKIIFSNKTVFINIIGNFILYMPYPMYIYKNKHSFLKYFVIIFGTIIVFEILQFVTKKGVFDIVDIVLNMSGAFIVLIILRIFKGENHEEKTKQ